MFRTVLFISLFVSNSVLGQGLFDGFLKGKGNNDLALSFASQNSTQYFAGRNLIDYKRNLGILNLFSEYGLTKRMDVIASVPLINFKLQDASLGLKYAVVDKQIGKGKLTLMPAVAFSTPLSNYATDIGQAIGQRATTFQFRGIMQYRFNDNWFVQSQAGYHYTLDPVPSAYVFSGKVGYMQNKLYIDVWYDRQDGIGDKDYQGTVPYDSFRELVVSHQRVGGVVYHQTFKKYGLFVNWSYLFDGRNAGKAYSVGAGCVWKFGKN